MIRCTRFGLVLLAGLSAGLSGSVRAAVAPPAAVRGQQALLGKTYAPATMAVTAYDNAWKHWGDDKKPADYDRLFRERYGLHPAPFPNDGYPMGVRAAEMNTVFGKVRGLTVDCLICHGGSIAGKSYVGLGNASLDYQAFYEEMSGPPGRRMPPPFQFSNVRGTSEAGGMAVFLLGFRNPDLTLRVTRLELDLQDDLCEDPPAWWLLKKKKTMYHTGGSDTRSVRSLMQFMMSPLNFPSAIHRAEADFTDIRAYLMSLEAPKFLLPLDQRLAERGREVFEATCSRCHGTYGPKGNYPNKIVSLEVVGTDRHRYDGITAKFGVYYDKSWFGEVHKSIPTDGYQAPPLDGVWATAPYLHNGSVPTLYHLLNSKTRPKIFTRSYRTDLDSYDEKKVGWKIQERDRAPDPGKVPAIEVRKVYDTTRPGRGNAGHTFGDRLTEDERMAVIEYLKTL
jgi:mono/diheme cytochrome c family protein